MDNYKGAGGIIKSSNQTEREYKIGKTFFRINRTWTHNLFLN